MECFPEPNVERGRTLSRISVAKGSTLNFRGRKSNSLMNLCGKSFCHNFFSFLFLFFTSSLTTLFIIIPSISMCYYYAHYYYVIYVFYILENKFVLLVFSIGGGLCFFKKNL